MSRRKVELIDISKVTPEDAASLTSWVKEVDMRGNGKYGEDRESYYIAIMWCNKQGKDISATGKTVLEAVVNVYNKLREIIG